MFQNRFFTLLIIVVLAAVVGLTLREAVMASAVGSELKEAERIQQSSAADTVRWEAMGEYYANQAQRYAMDSGTRSYIAWGEALNAAGKLGDAGVGSNMTQENIFASIDSNLDSATRSYIAWGLALEAAGKLRASGACSNTSRENVFERMDSTLDSATRSYIAWGLALQAKDDIRASCREATVESAESSSPIDECIDVSISELAACRAANQSASQ